MTALDGTLKVPEDLVMKGLPSELDDTVLIELCDRIFSYDLTDNVLERPSLIVDKFDTGRKVLRDILEDALLLASTRMCSCSAGKKVREKYILGLH